MSSAMACIATRFMSSGAAKSGKPCERFTAPYFIASRVISRITDSVKRLAFRDTRFEIEGAGVVMVELPTEMQNYTNETRQLFHLLLSVSICVYLWPGRSFNPVLEISTAQ